MRRLIVVAVEEGHDVDYELDPSDGWAWWEVVAALKRTLEKVEDAAIDQEIEEAMGDEETD